jgi:hypothetical protein
MVLGRGSEGNSAIKEKVKKSVRRIATIATHRDQEKAITLK